MYFIYFILNMHVISFLQIYGYHVYVYVFVLWLASQTS